MTSCDLLHCSALWQKSIECVRPLRLRGSLSAHTWRGDRCPTPPPDQSISVPPPPPPLPAPPPQLHPLLVLTVLVVAEHSLGVWGLLLAVPLTVFTLDYVLRCVNLQAAGAAMTGPATLHV